VERIGDTIEAALDKLNRAPALADGHKQMNARFRDPALRTIRTFAQARGEGDSDDGGLDPDVAADQDHDSAHDRDAAGRFTGGLDQGSRGAATKTRSPSMEMSARIRAAANHDDAGAEGDV
jgi:hypothetical protein